MITIGIITNNSADGLDAVITDFMGSTTRDIATISFAYSDELLRQLANLRSHANDFNGDMSQIAKLPLFNSVLDAITALQIKAVKALLASSKISKDSVAAIGISGLDVCDYHISDDTHPFSSTLIFKPAKLAKETGIDVIYDFFADDIINGGRGYPFMPIHLLHLSSTFAFHQNFPVCFIDGGRTAKMTLVTENGRSIKRQVISFDCGAFNYYINLFLQKKSCPEGDVFTTGFINPVLLADLYANSALLPDGSNFYEKPLPKIADIHYYGMFDKLSKYPLLKEDILRTLQYFAAYVTFMSLRFIPANVDFPKCFAVFGKGWDNSVIFHDFQNLLHGRGFVLPEHKSIYTDILSHLRGTSFSFGECEMFNINSRYMKARAFADMAYCYLNKIVFNAPEVTNCHKGSVCGIICHVGENTRRRGAGFTYTRVS